MNSNGAFFKTVLIFAGIPTLLWSSLLWMAHENLLEMAFDWMEWFIAGLQFLNLVIMIAALRYYSAVLKAPIRYGRAFLVELTLSGCFFWGFIVSASLAIGEFPRVEELLFELIPVVWLPLIGVGLIIAAVRKHIMVRNEEMEPVVEGDILDQHMVGDE